jgi:hypothetical protein
MITITSRRNIFGFYFTLLLWCFFYFVMALMIIGIFIHQYNSALFETRNYGLLPLLILIVIAAIYTTYKFFKTAPNIELDNQSITFNRSETYFWKDLEKLELTGKRPFLFLTEREGVILKFKGKKNDYFWMICTLILQRLKNLFNMSLQIK